MATLSRVEKPAHEWDSVMNDHREAMVVRDVEEAVDYGVLALRVWFRTIEDWHADVSQAADRYVAEEHEQIKRIESFLLVCGRRTANKVAMARGQGYDVDGAQEFQSLLDRLESCALPIDEQSSTTALKKCFDHAVREHESGETETVENPWTD